MIDFPLQALIGVVAAVAFRRRGDRVLTAAGKGALVSIAVTTLLGVVLAVTAGTDWAALFRRILGR